MIFYSKKKTKSNLNSRIAFLKMLFFVFALIIISRLFYLQVLKYDYYKTLAQTRHSETQEIVPNRGTIFVQDTKNNNALIPVAQNQEFYLFYGVPAVIENVTSTIAQIEQVLSFTDEERWQIFLRLNKPNDPDEPISKYLTSKEKQALEKLNIVGTGFKPQIKRVYPQNNLFSHILGFLGFKNNERVGQYGIEEYFENELAGKSQTIEFEKDSKGRIIDFEQSNLDKIQDGVDLVLTIDPTIQFKVCAILEDWQKKMLAEDATAIVVNPKSGQILSMCDKPDFDLNNYSQVENINFYLNKSISQSYEPGSVFKAISMATAIDLEKVNPQTEYEDKGFLKFGPDTIRNANNEKYGKVNMTQVLDFSINTGMVFATLKIGTNNFKKYIENFGFGAKTGIQLPVESAGNISSLKNKSDIYLATASYGQGILTTPLQLIMAYSVIANQGILMQPQIILEKRFKNGSVEKFSPQQSRRVISSKTANILKAMLVSVVKNGHGNQAQVDGYYIAGKTGTANIAKENGKGYTDETIHTFVGFAPVDDSKFVILVKFSKPKNVPFSSDSAAPAFAEIAKFLLQYYQVPPDF